MNPYGQFCLPEHFDFELSIVRHMQDWQILESWKSIGSPKLCKYGLDWYGGEATDGRRSIDNRHGGRCFRVFMLITDSPEMLEKRCCVLAHRYKLHLIGDEDA